MNYMVYTLVPIHMPGETMDLAKMLRKYMDDSNMTIRHLSEISNLPEDTIKAILYHKVKDVKLSTVVKLANAFCCSIDDLIDRSISHVNKV